MTGAWASARVIAAVVVAVVAVRLSASELVATRAEDLIRQAIRARLAAETAEVTLIRLDTAAAADQLYRAVRIDPGAALGRPIRITLVLPNGRTEIAAVTVRIVADQVVALRPIERGQTVQADDVGQRRGDIRGIPLRRLPRIDEVVGGRALREIPAGAVVLPSAVALRRLVEAGDRVTAIARVGDAQVTAELVASDAGDAGDVIRLSNPDSRRAIRGRVLRAGVVEVRNGQ